VQDADEEQRADVLVVGSGIAGLTFALKAAEWADVRVVTKKYRADSATNYARGGLAAIMAADDRPELHIQDTLVAGAGLCHLDAVDVVVREGPARAMELMGWGVGFHREGEGLSLGREGGHSRRRILHAGDRTGREIERALLEAMAAHPRIQIVENLLVVDLLIEESIGGGRRRCAGALALDHRTGRRMRLLAPSTLLATGGVGQVFQHTTNPSIATGDGVAMAFRAGATVSNMEFIQFHPTALYPTEDPAFLLSEALRGEGAILRRPDGSSFMELYHPDGALAPRDIVARAIVQELRKSGADHVYLDVSPIPRDLLESRFPGAVHGCRARGIDLSGPGIPVVPAAHYSCGGVRSDLEGRTDLEGLFVAGEVACTGTHGANRLASNSLLEAVVFSHRAAACIRSAPAAPGAWGPARAPEAEVPRGGGPSPSSLAELRSRLRARMWEEAGIVRTDRGLNRVREEVDALRTEVAGRWAQEPWTEEATELRNLLDTAALILEGARWRKESRGLHYNLDHPNPDDANFRRDSLIPGGGAMVADPGGGALDFDSPRGPQEGVTTIFPKT
jgi:L-aspartate oxidase